jgi:hypothetical protein
MTERFEWIEPEEATAERREKQQAVNCRYCRACWLFGSVLAVPAAIAIPVLHQNLGIGVAEAFANSGRIVAASFLLPAVLSVLQQLERKPSQRRCILPSAESNLWKRVLSFEIIDHPTLPEIRTILIHHKSSPNETQDYFRPGQINEAELRHFLEARIAEQRAQRLMRRVERKL